MMKEFILKEDITLDNAYEVKEELLNALKETNDGLIINFRDISIIDSTGLGILVSLFKRVKEQNKKLELINLNNNIRSIMKITMLDTVFCIK